MIQKGGPNIFGKSTASHHVHNAMLCAYLYHSDLQKMVGYNFWKQIII